MRQEIIYFSLDFLKAHEKAIHTVFDISKNTQRLNVYQVCHQKKKKRQPYRFLFLSVKHRNWVNPKI